MRMETNRRRIVARLEAEGWINVGGGKHDGFRHPNKPEGFITVPRHKELSPGVARTIAKGAGWT
jgi:predicted RNA binding protein YcfA (HicA-like mRNA interferase family)